MTSTNPENHWKQFQAAIRQSRGMDLANLPRYQGKYFLEVWRAFFENDRKTRLFFGASNSNDVLDDLWVEMMQELVDAGLAPTPEQVGARSPLMAWAHRLIGKVGAARDAVFSGWSSDLGARITAAQARQVRR